MEKDRKDREMAKLRSKIMSKLPKEPKEEKEEGQPVSKLRFRVPTKAQDDPDDKSEDQKKSVPPNGIVGGGNTTASNQLERRFLASQSLQTVLDYLTTEGYPSSEYKVLSSYPRRDVSILKPLIYINGGVYVWVLLMPSISANSFILSNLMMK